MTQTCSLEDLPVGVELEQREQVVEVLLVPDGKAEFNIESLLQLIPTDASVQFSTVAQSCPTLCDPMNHSTPGLPVHHKPPEFTQTHVHQVSEAIQPSYPLSSPSPAPQSLPASGSFPMSQLFAWGGQSTGVSASASVLPMNTQDWSL